MTESRDRGLVLLLQIWRSQWQAALAAWSRFTKLAEPRWCLTEWQEDREKLSDSFAMIRLVDHAVVISLRQIRDAKLEKFATEILAHEVGHHVYAPGDLRDNARLLARVRAGLPTREQFTGMIANLYTDLLINDRLQRSVGLDMSGVYRVLRADVADDVWNLYMRIYEVLWRLPSGTLAAQDLAPQLRADGDLGARVIRAYARDWLAGAGRFAMLFLTYLLEIPENRALLVKLPPWFDTDQAGAGDAIPDGMAAIEEDELDGVIHPAEDEALTGLGDLGEEDGANAPESGGAATIGGKKEQYRSPSQYTELMKSIGVEVSEKDLLIRYYRERALGHLVRFPTRMTEESKDPLPEGIDVWDVGSPMKEIDWMETVIRSPVVIPGITTVRRTYGVTEGNAAERHPVDLYIGIDCSGSMSNPAHSLSYPVVAGTVITLSALRTGARVMACLSGEPGRFSQTSGFVRNEKQVMNILCGYLGTGYAYGVERLRSTFLEGEKLRRPTHILVVSDQDMFHMLDSCPDGWQVAQQAVELAGGGGTFVLEISRDQYRKGVERMEQIGWSVYTVTSQEELLAFAHAFSKANYEQNRESRST